MFSSTMAHVDTLAAVQAGSLSWAGMLLWGVVSILQLASSLLYWAFWLGTIRIPTLLFTMFSTTWTVTMNATTLMLILAAFISLATLVVRYRLLNTYSRLPPEPQRKEPEIDLFPDTHDGGPKAGLSSYLDEFLSAIKIFGYLERPVFHELTRSMQTRKLIAGETFDLEEEKGFCIVVDGLVEIFVKSGRNSTVYEDPCAEEDDPVPGQQRYQLLTEVRNGAPMSSLFSIMSLFTEDIPLGQADYEISTPPTSARSAQSPVNHTAGHGHRNPLEAEVSLPTSPHLDAAAPGLSQPLTGQSVTFGAPAAATATIPPMYLDDTQTRSTRPRNFNRNASSSAHPDIIARATVDTTIAIIPASAFRRLIKIYPKATTHIVHVILSRFQRVTLAQAFTYLGLTGEVLQAEKGMLQYTTCLLPNVLRGDALHRLKEKFNQERERSGAAAGETKGIALHNAATGRARRSSVSLLKEATTRQSMSKRAPMAMVTPSSAATRDRSGRHHPSPGDLIGDFELARTVMNRPTLGREDSLLKQGSPRMSPLSQKSLDPLSPQNHTRVWMNSPDERDEDSLFRVSVVECVLKVLGFGASGATSSKEAESVEGSPRLLSLDHRRQKALFGSNNAFGFIGPYEGSADGGETESMISDATGYATAPNPQVLSRDLKDDVEIVFFPKGSVLVDQGERSPGLYYVIQGFLDVGCDIKESPNDNLRSHTKASVFRDAVGAHDDRPGLEPFRNGSSGDTAGQNPNHQRQRRSVALIKPGGIAGYVSTVSSCRSFVDVVAKTDVYVGFLPRASLERIVDRYPIALLVMAKRLTHTLPRLLLHIDFALEWVQVNAGQVIFHDKDESDAIYIVLNGRLRLVEDKKEGGVSSKAEFGQGESVGELEVLTESVRSGTLHAIRDTELVKFPRTLFNSLALEHPNITIKISKIIASRMRSLIDDPAKLQGADAGLGTSAKGSSNFNLGTVAILPVAAGVPIVEFGHRLMSALAQVGPPNGATSLDQAAVLNHLGKHAFSRIGKLRLSQYLADLEEKYGLVVYVADTNVNSPWTQTCITQADCVLLVGIAEDSPEIGEYERFMLGMKSTARKTLVLIHGDRYLSPGVSRSWLRNRTWINGGHHHVQMSITSSNLPVHSTSRRLGAALRERVQTLQAELLKYTSRKGRTAFYSPDTTFKGDFHRLARKLCGKSVGLVLGGGGARGLSQMGIIRAMEEEGIPIDMVGGTSIGAFIGALYARHADVVTIYGLAKKFCGRIASMWRLALDLTYPSVAYTTGHEFNRGIFKTFGNAQIEDFWLDFYCNTTNISKSRPEFHNSGYAWRYIRASMSLAGLLPPLCDEGSMLVDGGYIDNLTVSHMKRLGADIVFAVEVGSVDDDTPQTYGDSLSGLWSIFNRWNPFSSHANPPTMADIQGRLAYVSSVEALERAKTTPGCIYMRPPIDDYATLDFGKFDELYELGYNYGKEFLRKLRERGELRLAQTTEEKKAMRRTMRPRRASI